MNLLLPAPLPSPADSVSLCASFRSQWGPSGEGSRLATCGQLASRCLRPLWLLGGFAGFPGGSFGLAQALPRLPLRVHMQVLSYVKKFRGFCL